ncbi:MAG TPA: TOBE domain-containing protein [bacterium]|nr:TOBE domain-containing protein [bacterium]
MGEYLTADEAASLLRLHVKRVQALARAGKLPGRRVGRKWLFPRAELASRLQRETPWREETEVEISARNQLRGRVTAIGLGGIMAEVRVQIGTQELVSVITRASIDRLGIKIGDDVMAIIKSTEVMIGKP